jgi:RNA polymerase sigma-70 factor (ECF subfamily)
VQPHERALRAYLQARFPSLTDRDDIVQEAYLRVLKAYAAGTVRGAKAYLFTTARNAALDLLRRRKVRAEDTVTPFTDLHVLDDQRTAADETLNRQELEILVQAVRALPERCRQVVMLRWFEGLSGNEIAARLGVSINTVKAQLNKGMRRCTGYFAERGLLKLPPTDPK